MNAQELLDYLCNTLQYRFFTGIPTTKLLPIYNNMDETFMHYIPATNINIAIGMAIGTFMAGIKSIVLLGKDQFKCVSKQSLDRIIDMQAHILFITDGVPEETSFPIDHIVNYRTIVFDKTMVLVFNEGGGDA